MSAIFEGSPMHSSRKRRPTHKVRHHYRGAHTRSRRRTVLEHTSHSGNGAMDYTLLEGTYFQGYVQTPFSALVAAFGTPGPGDDDGKITYRWLIVFADGTVATVYDWKVSSRFRGPEGITPRELRSAASFSWTIGGHTKLAIWRIRQALAKVKGR